MPDSSLQTITKEAFLSHRHPLQRRRFALALFFALILFPLIGAALVAGTVVLIVPIFAFMLWVAGRVWFARFLGNCILASEMNYPRIYNIGEELKTLIGYKKTVNIFVYEQGNFNAYLLKFFFYRRAVFLNSELLEAGVTDDELRWLIGRFIGYLRARREAGFWGWTIRAAQHLLVFNLFLMPYERALVYSGDRIALAVIYGDITSAVSAMQKLFVGRQLGYSVNPSGMIEQHRQVKGSIFAFLARLGMGFPHMTARYVDLIGFAKEAYPAQYARFDAENPGLPADLLNLVALPGVPPTSSGDPVFGSLLAALVIIALFAFVTVKFIVPEIKHRNAYTDESTTYTPPSDDTSQTVPSTPSPQPAADATASDAQPYASTDGRFSVSFPSAPTTNSQQIALAGGDSVTLYQFQSGDDNVAYSVLYSDYPSQYVSAGAQEVLEHGRDGFVNSTKSTITSDQAIDLNGVPGRAFTCVDQNGNTFTEHNYLDGQRLYQVLVSVTRGYTADHADDFFNSFRIQ